MARPISAIQTWLRDAIAVIVQRRTFTAQTAVVALSPTLETSIGMTED